MENKFQEILEQEVAEDMRQNYINAVMQGLMDGVFCMLYATTILAAYYYISWNWLEVGVVMPILYTLMQSLPQASKAFSVYSSEAARSNHAVKHVFNSLDQHL